MGIRVKGYYPPFPHSQMKSHSTNAFSHGRAVHCCMWWSPSTLSTWLRRVKVRQSEVISTVWIAYRSHNSILLTLLK